MQISERARKRTRLRRSGGSRTVVLPKRWLNQAGIPEEVDEVEIVQTSEGILIQAVERAENIEEEPEFAQFLAFLAKDALAQPEKLGDVGELMDDADLFENVQAD